MKDPELGRQCTQPVIYMQMVWSQLYVRLAQRVDSNNYFISVLGRSVPLVFHEQTM